MKSKEEIEALALNEYPTKHGEYDSELINSSERQAFIKGYEMAKNDNQELTSKVNFLLKRIEKDRLKQRFSVRLALDKLERALTK